MSYIAKMVSFVNSVLAKLSTLLYTGRKKTKGLHSMSDDTNKPAISTTVTGSQGDIGPKIKMKAVKRGVDGEEQFYAPRVPFVGEYETIRDAYDNSQWFREFIYEIINMYGYPVSSLDCETQKDKVMFSWAMLHVTDALSKERGLWHTLFDVDDPVMTADFFCRTFYEKRKSHVIPGMPSGKEGLVVNPQGSSRLRNKSGKKSEE